MGGLIKVLSVMTVTSTAAADTRKSLHPAWAHFLAALYF